MWFKILLNNIRIGFCHCRMLVTKIRKRYTDRALQSAKKRVATLEARVKRFDPPPRDAMTAFDERFPCPNSPDDEANALLKKQNERAMQELVWNESAEWGFEEVVYRRTPDGNWKCDETGEVRTQEDMDKFRRGTWSRVV